MKDEKTLTEILLENNKYMFLKNYLELNKNEILNILDLKFSYKSIFEAIKKKTDLNIEYRHFCRILSDFKTKYIYNLSESEYKKQMQAISQPATATPEKKDEIKQAEILAAKISESEQPAQPKEPEKIEIKKSVPADEKPSGKIPKWKQEGFNSLNEYFKYLKSQPKSMELKEEFIWKPT